MTGRAPLHGAPGLIAFGLAMLAGTIVVAAQSSAPTDTKAAITKGVTYLRAEVPKWKAEHPCYSCHNNGDATRALLVAGSKGFDIGDSIDDTLAFLRDPSKWEQNKMRDGLVDKGLARVQFASALAVANRLDRRLMTPSRKPRSCSSPIKRPTDRGRSIQARRSAPPPPTERRSPPGRRARR